jgi:hypothetical protein
MALHDRRPPPLPAKQPKAIAGDEQPDRRAVRHHPGLEGADQAPPQRSITLNGIQAPKLPGELAPTMPAPSTTADTRRPATPAEGIPIRPQVVAMETSPGGQPGASLPPASSNPDAASAAALRRELAEAKLAKEAETEARKRLELELAAKAAAEEAAAKKKPADPERIWGVPLRNALIGFMAAVTALGAPAAIWLTAQAEIAKQEAARQKLITEQLQAQVSAAKLDGGKAKLEASASKAELAHFKAYFREVMRLQGVEIAKHKDDPEAGDLKPTAPLCQPGKVCAGPQLIITVPP